MMSAVTETTQQSFPKTRDKDSSQTVAHACSPSMGKLRQDDGQELKTNLGYRVK